MKKLIVAICMFVTSLVSNSYADGHGVKMGIILGFTGPIESLTPAMAASAELAFKEASDSGSLLGGKKIMLKERTQHVLILRPQHQLLGLVSGGLAIMEQIVLVQLVQSLQTLRANGVVMFHIALRINNFSDNGYFFRTVISARWTNLADITKDRGVKSVATTYTK